MCSLPSATKTKRRRSESNISVSADADAATLKKPRTEDGNPKGCTGAPEPKAANSDVILLDVPVTPIPMTAPIQG